MSTKSSEIINAIASKIVLLEPEDIQALGDILKLLDELNVNSIQDFVIQVRSIVERLILDEYESSSVGMNELSAAIEQLQMAHSETEYIDEEEFKEKQEALLKNNAEENSNVDHTIQLEDEAEDLEIADSVEEIEPTEPEPVAKQEKKSEPKKVKQVEPELLDDLESDDTDEIHNYFSTRDDISLINSTIKEDPELLQGFIEETDEHIQMIENGLIDWESSPNDLSIIDSIFRPFHTIKGVAGFLNLTDINNFSHMYEDILDEVRKGTLQFSQALSDAIFQGVDALKKMIGSIVASMETGKYEGHDVDLEYFGALVSRARKGDLATDSQLKKSKTQPTQPSTSSSSTISSSSSTVSSSSTNDKTGSRALGATKDSNLRVSTTKMDSLIDLVGELVVTQNMVVQNTVVTTSTDKRLMQDVGQLKRITGNLQDLSMSLRMVPIKDTFQKMHRIVRDLAKKSGKKIVLEVNGEDTEIDRNMVDELYDPLVHMIRNNSDHGIELPEVRKARGKPETGTITLNAYYKGGMVVIEVIDDGNGIDVQKIRKKAIENGIISDSEVLNEQQTLDLIFSSGFSTSQNITDVSGRGVGMDVVKKAINNLRGNIEIHTKIGKGTTFSLRLPLTLAIIDGVIVEIGQERYIIPTVSIKESLIIKEDQYNRIAGKGETLFIRDKVLPLIRVGEHFGINEAIKNPWDGLIIIVESDKQEAALLIDKMIDKQEIVIKSLGDSLSKINGLAGGAILSDGQVGLIIDVPTLLPKSERTYKD